MGKRQHQKDKMYLTCKEWTTLYGGKKHVSETSEFRRLPFDHCSLSLQPFERPYCDQDGNVFDLAAIVPFLKKFRCNPITGEKLDAKSLVKLNYHKNAEGKFHCPVMFKCFNNNSHIVAIKKTGNVYSHEAVEELNMKTHCWRDLLTDEEISRSELVTLQDPSNLQKFNLSNFHHLRRNLKVQDEDLERARYDSAARLKKVNMETRETLDQLKKDFKPKEEVVVEKKVADKFNAAHYSTGAVAAGFTSTAVDVETKHEAAIIDEDIVRYERVKKKGYIRLVTNLGPLNLELACDMVPKTCENYIRLCQEGYYDGTKFHRSIRNFMIQGGDPTGTGKGGRSCWSEKKSFKDEFKPNLTHAGRGILSMANSGPNTNKSQFFITYRSCKHLDGKHTVFGKVVGGLDTLTAMERIMVDEKDRPLQDIILDRAQVFVDPFEEADVQLASERAEESRRHEADLQAAAEAKRRAAQGRPQVFRKGVGKYIDMEGVAGPSKSATSHDRAELTAKKRNVGYDFGGFSNW